MIKYITAVFGYLGAPLSATFLVAMFWPWATEQVLIITTQLTAPNEDNKYLLISPSCSLYSIFMIANILLRDPFIRSCTLCFVTYFYSSNDILCYLGFLLGIFDSSHSRSGSFHAGYRIQTVTVWVTRHPTTHHSRYTSLLLHRHASSNRYHGYHGDQHLYKTTTQREGKHKNYYTEQRLFI